MTAIIRRPNMADGGITEDERRQMAECVREWNANAFKTGRTDRAALAAAIIDLYAVANLPPPIVVVVPSPLVMAVYVFGNWYGFTWLFNHAEFINTDGSTEPCGQKVEG